MKFNQLSNLTKITNFTEKDYISIINILYGLDCRLTFKDNNKYNLSKNNVVVINR